MYQLLETIRVEEGVLLRPELHAERMRESARVVNGVPLEVDEGELLRQAGAVTASTGTWKLRIVYDDCIRAIEAEPYRRPRIRSLRLVPGGGVRYPFKYADRSELDTLKSRRGPCDDVLIVERGFLTDTSFSNIALFDGNGWVTPAEPLLPGLMRRELLEAGRIRRKALTSSDLRPGCTVSLINAMNELGELTLPADSILTD